MLQSARALMNDIALRHRLGLASTEPDERAVLIGLVGRGITSSRSPIMHQREGNRLGIHCTYALIDFDDAGLGDDALGDVIATAEGAGFAGLNITHPFKQAVVDHLTDLAPDAAAIGAVNTVCFAHGRRTGHNTDSWGFAESFRLAMNGASLTAVALFGAGGGGAAVAYALLQLGVERLVVCDADTSRGAALAQMLADRFGRTVEALADPAAALENVSGVVNATPVGMEKYPGTPFDTGLLKPHHWVADIVYFPADTRLLRAARTRGCRTLPGTGMAVYQAVMAFELFTGIAADRDAMTRHFEAAA